MNICSNLGNLVEHLTFKCFLFLFLAVPVACEIPGPGIESAPQQWPGQLQWQHQILNQMCHKGTPKHLLKFTFILEIICNLKHIFSKAPKLTGLFSYINVTYYTHSLNILTENYLVSIEVSIKSVLAVYARRNSHRNLMVTFFTDVHNIGNFHRLSFYS